MSAATLIALAVAIPVAAAVLIALTHRMPNVRDGISIGSAILLLLAVAGLLPDVLAGESPSLTAIELLPALAITFRVEPLGMIFALVAASLWPVSALYAVGYMRGNDESHQTRFFACFALALAGAIGVAFAGNLLTLFLFYEVLTLVTWPLVTHHGDADARRGGRIYLGVLLFTSTVLFLPAIAITWHLTGTLDFVPGGILEGKVSGWGAIGLLALFMFGIGKAALMPFHHWLPAAMVAPTPVSALLHAVAVVKAGVFTIVKVVLYIFGTDAFGAETFGWLVWVAAFTILAASIVALRADNLKRRLAYSTVSQLAYIVLAVALLAPLSIVGAALHIAAHAFGKITLFFAAGAIYTAGHKTEVSQLDGIGRLMPWTMAAFTIGALSIIGIPPAVGFFSKWLLFTGVVQSGQHVVLGVLLLSTLLNAAYFLPIVYAAFFRPLAAGEHHGEAPLPAVLALVATAAATLTLPFITSLPFVLASLLGPAGTGTVP